MTPVLYRLGMTDDGETLCVTMTTADYSRADLITHYWPVASASPWSLFRLYYDTVPARETWALELDEWEVRQVRPGEYYLRHEHHCPAGTYARLEQGGHTNPVKTTERPCPRPRSKLPLVWSGGHWHSYGKQGHKRYDHDLTKWK